MKRDLAVLVALLAIFWVLSPNDFYTNLGSRILIAAILAFSLNLLLGDAGLMSLAQNAICGVAAYGVAWFTVVQGYGHLPAALLAVVVSVAVAAGFGAVSLRVQGIGFLMITLALGQIVWGLAQRWVELTGGENGITGLDRPHLFGLSIENPKSFYVFSAIVFLLVFAVLRVVSRSAFGAAVRGTRDQARRMSALGYDVWRIRWATFVMAGLLAGIAGILEAYYNKFASPGLLSITEAAATLLMVIVGGSSMLLGPFCGAIVVLLLTQVVSSYTEHWVGLMGALFLFTVLFMPDGILPALARLAARLRAGLFGRKAVEETPPLPVRTVP